jgi:hypothetical protein
MTIYSYGQATKHRISGTRVKVHQCICNSVGFELKQEALEIEFSRALMERRIVMEIYTVNYYDKSIAVITSNETLLSDVQSAVDFMMTVQHETGCNHIVINKSIISEDFFQLTTKLAGEILQKFINYNVKLAIVGDFSVYRSKSLKNFIWESNMGKDIFFVSDEKQAIAMLSRC